MRTRGWCHTACWPHWALYRSCSIYPSDPTGITIPPSSQQRLGGDRDSHRVRGDGVKGMTSVPPPGRSPIVWKMANGTTMPAARSSRLRVSTHSTAGRCRQETHKSPSTRWNHTEKRQSKSDFNSVCPPVSRGSQSATSTGDELHIALCATGKNLVPPPPGRDLVQGGGGGLARSRMTHKLKQNKGAHFEPETGKRRLQESDALRKTLMHLTSREERVLGPGHFPEAEQSQRQLAAGHYSISLGPRSSYWRRCLWIWIQVSLAPQPKSFLPELSHSFPNPGSKICV